MFNVQCKVLIVGDVMIDRYLEGVVERISPEAAVPVVRLKYTENRLGGAANVALNINSLGGVPYLCSVIGEDNEGQLFEALLKEENLLHEGILKSKNRITTVKSRILNNNQQLLRLDSEILTPLNVEEENALINLVKKLIIKEKINVVLFQDYNKGILTKNVIEAILKISHSLAIPTIVDPKFHHFWAYKGVTLFKPNLAEVAKILGFNPNPTSQKSLQQAANLIQEKLQNKHTLITLSEHGMYLNTPTSDYLIPTKAIRVADVCGAGDTVISVMAMGIAHNMDLYEIAILANLAGGLVCQQAGVVPVNKDALEKAWRNI